MKVVLLRILAPVLTLGLLATACVATSGDDQALFDKLVIEFSEAMQDYMATPIPNSGDGLPSKAQLEDFWEEGDQRLTKLEEIADRIQRFSTKFPPEDQHFFKNLRAWTQAHREQANLLAPCYRDPTLWLQCSLDVINANGLRWQRIGVDLTTSIAQITRENG